MKLVFHRSIKSLVNSGGKKEMKLLTIHELVKLYKSNSLVWGNTFNKLPVLKFNQEQLKVIDSFQKNN